jgi:hypothetical protein
VRTTGPPDVHTTDTRVAHDEPTAAVDEPGIGAPERDDDDRPVTRGRCRCIAPRRSARGSAPASTTRALLGRQLLPRFESGEQVRVRDLLQYRERAPALEVRRRCRELVVEPDAGRLQLVGKTADDLDRGW